MAAASGSVQSVERTLDILEALSGAPFGLLLTELAAATGLHVSTAHRLVNVLVERGYATKESGSGKYRLTLRTFAIGSRVSGVWDLLSAARPYLERLASLSQEAVHLVERDGNSVVYLYKAEPFRQLVRMVLTQVCVTPCTAPVWARVFWHSCPGKKWREYGNRNP